MKNSLSNYDGGHCLTSNMKMVIHVCNGSSGERRIKLLYSFFSLGGVGYGAFLPLLRYDSRNCKNTCFCFVLFLIDPKCIDAPKISPSSSVSSCAPVTERVHHSSTPSLSSRGSSSVLVHRSSPTQYFSTTTFAGLTNTTLALKSSATVQCQGKTLWVCCMIAFIYRTNRSTFRELLRLTKLKQNAERPEKWINSDIFRSGEDANKRYA